MDKVFEKNFGFHFKQRTTRKVQYLVFINFSLTLSKFSFWEEHWALGYHLN